MNKFFYHDIIKGLARTKLMLTSGLKCAILNYHSIGDDLLSVPSSVFESTIKTLSENGYIGISIDNLTKFYADSDNTEKKLIVITFDDCFESAYTKGVPILQNYGFSGTFYISTGYIGKTDSRRNKGILIERSYIKLEQIKELLHNNFEIGAHTDTHPNLTDISPLNVRTEIHRSKEILQDYLGTEINSFAYPRGKHNENIVGIVKESGFSSATTSNLPGINTTKTNVFKLKRYGGGVPTQGLKLLDLASGMLDSEMFFNQFNPLQLIKKLHLL